MVSRRRQLVLTATCAIIVAAGLIGAPLASAEDAIPSQEYVTVTGLDQLKAQGFDGSGVTIAVLDGNIDTSVPELVGADIEVKASCTNKGAMHGTGTISDLADPVWGWAPKAHFLTYAPEGLVGTSFEEGTSGCEGSQDDMIQRAINDGADIINISASTWVLNPYTASRAAMRGIPIVTGSGNYGEYGDTVLSSNNTVVIVGATNMQGQRSAYSQYGVGLTVMAPADPHIFRIPDVKDGPLTRIVTNDGGTSTATPMVTGALALAMQKWPDANGNQLIASLIATADRADHWDQYYGYGMFNPAGLISNDPSHYSTENPLMNAIPDAYPTQEQYDNYVNGTVEFASSISPYDEDYTPAGTSAGTPSPSPTPQTGTSTWILPVGITAAIVVIGLVILIVVMTRRHRATTPPKQSPRPQQPYPMGQPYPQQQQPWLQSPPGNPYQPTPPGQQPHPPSGQPYIPPNYPRG